ncbi:type II secretion system F family protein [Mechercharimyces sp. CAU 1602]|uniref:type II secretion system F family protein n=1 Tax=Mechercharimyces sp. CAU 1602 TaxID=2973933 RepID=UPI00216121E6|nr:type II secretion system F family protein [Mechercharimyces sp. CAU 1602]MCS1352431.1 type II secretion system F family protein [Mechercharimyces sp. CAU 1602]
MDTGLLVALFGGGAVFCWLLAMYHVLKMRRAKGRTSERVEKWFTSDSTARWSDSLADRLDEMKWAKKLEPKLKRASIKLRPSEYGAIMIVGWFAILLFFYYLMSFPFWVSFLLADILLPLGSTLLLSSRKHIYVHQINKQLSEVCRLLSSAARAGLSIPQGLELVVKEMPSPIKDELGIVVRELKLGKDTEMALKDMLVRVKSKDVQVFVNALIIQRRAGGDLASVLAEMANTMEERKIIHKTIDSTIAQARYSAYLLPIISIFIVVMMSKMIDNFYDFFTSMFGIIVVSIFVVMQVLGFIIVKKIADIRV